MLRTGPSSGEIRNMSGEDIFSSRLKLLIIMAKAYLTGCPIGKYRKQAIIENSRCVFYHSLQLVNKMASSKDQGLKVQACTVCRFSSSTEVGHGPRQTSKSGFA